MWMYNLIVMIIQKHLEVYNNTVEMNQLLLVIVLHSNLKKKEQVKLTAMVQNIKMMVWLKYLKCC